MKKLVLIISVAILGSLSPVYSTDLKDVDAVVTQAMDAFEVPGAAVGIVYEGRLIYAKGFGYRDFAHKAPVTPDTLFAIASCTKAFTTFVLASLVEEGVIKWDDPVIKHIPELSLNDPSATQNITIRDLATHRSGLPRHDFVWYNSDVKRDDLLKRLPYLEPTYELREKFQYNNIMYAVAGILIERVTGNSWEDEVKTRILEPLGMSHSNFTIEDLQKSPNFSLPHAVKEGQFKAIPFRSLTNIGPAGSINSTIEDLSKWVALQLSCGELGNRQLLRQESFNQLHTLQVVEDSIKEIEPSYQGYGLGWFIGTYENRDLVEHMGAIDGFLSTISLLPQEKIGVIVLSNGDAIFNHAGTRFVNSVSRSIFDTLLGLAPKDWVQAVQKTPHTYSLNDYTGEYEHPGYGHLSIALQNGQLVATFNRIVTPLIHKEGDTFLGSDDSDDPGFADFEFSFHSLQDEKNAQVHVSFESKPIIFTKVK